MRHGRRIACTGLAIALGSACLPGPRDLLVERCTEVIAYRSPGLRSISIEEIERGPGPHEVALQFEAHDVAADEEFASRIACRFDPENRWSPVELHGDERPAVLRIEAAGDAARELLVRGDVVGLEL
ncbi:MAG TPA: hypothetical protein VNF72_18940, partial [Myxococcota bacterium]|nr:hypothetical protein [Myxococcota bacterium]